MILFQNLLDLDAGVRVGVRHIEIFEALRWGMIKKKNGWETLLIANASRQ